MCVSLSWARRPITRGTESINGFRVCSGFRFEVRDDALCGFAGGQIGREANTVFVGGLGLVHSGVRACDQLLRGRSMLRKRCDTKTRRQGKLQTPAAVEVMTRNPVTNTF